ncbi:MAG: FAD-dependent oxidoreductase [Chloroflexi bacterium]|nr:FAD-dependent oxidoreductase [Chloroflexota bacterium]
MSDNGKTNQTYDVIIAGQGAAGYAAAMYAARYQIKPIILGATFGGETATGGLIENYPGYVGIDGFELMMNFKAQSENYDVPIIDENVASITRKGHCFEATTTEGNKFQASTVILAVGRERRRLYLPHEEEWTGRGVSFCSTCDAPLHRNNVVAVVGGGDAAIKGAVLLSKYAKQVYVVYRGEKFWRPEAVNLTALEAAENVTFLMETNVVELKGTDGLDSIVLDKPVNGSKELKVDGIFIEIGADPRKELAVELGVALNDKDEVIVDKFMATNVHGVYAAGDLTDGSGELKQTITAAAQGAVAATSVNADVAAHPNACELHYDTSKEAVKTV